MERVHSGILARDPPERAKSIGAGNKTVGFLDWILGRRTDDRVIPHTNRVRRSEQPHSDAGSTSAVATLERPAKAVADSASQSESSENWWAPEGVTQTELPAIARPELTPEAIALENTLVSHFDGHDLSIPPLPRTAEKVLERLRDPGVNLPKIAEDIAEDQVLAAAVLRLVNSPMYRGLSHIASLPLAIARLGTNIVRTMMVQQSVRASLFDKQIGNRALAEVVWRRSLGSACIMRSLSRFTKVDQEDAFLVGLLHDIGNVMVLRIMHAQQMVMHDSLDVATFEYLCHETHQEFGELIADAWGLPEALKALIAKHHTYPESDDPLRLQRLQLIASDSIAAMLGYAPTAQLNLLGSRAILELGLADPDNPNGGSPSFLEYLRELPDMLAEATDIGA